MTSIHIHLMRFFNRSDVRYYIIRLLYRFVVTKHLLLIKTLKLKYKLYHVYSKITLCFYPMLLNGPQKSWYNFFQRSFFLNHQTQYINVHKSSTSIHYSNFTRIFSLRNCVQLLISSY